jgi:serine/threonine protein kinase/tetratricopeptide (TPR) repeat protein
MSERDNFIAALQCDGPAGRSAYLGAACGGDAGLRRRVERLLRLHDEASGFLEQPALAGLAPADPPEAAGARVGPYELLQKLGEGGMGAVWVAEQSEPVERRVALKLIKPGMDSAQFVTRFEQERQALALMDHPNIARVLDAGASAAGRPYLVMELVKGVPLTRFCDQEHLTPRERLELAIPVCQAVQHAHQKGVIHRDLKPSNVLVALYDGKPVPKVIDFGVAKATGQRLAEKPPFTEVGQIVGTLEYMAPEQAELNNLDIDTRADVYSLGVLLYELLTGTTPFTAEQLRGTGIAEMLRLIREVEPPRPSQRLSSSAELAVIAANRRLEPKRLTRLVHGDLDWVVMKCLEKDRGRRYETAGALALDLRHYLADEPVAAGPPSAGYRLRKFVRRNRGPVLAVALLFTALLLGIAGTTTGMVRAWEAEQLAEDRLADVETANIETGLALKQTQKAQAATKLALDDSEAARGEAEAVSKFLGDAFRRSDPLVDGTELKVVELLDRAAEQLESKSDLSPKTRAKLLHQLGMTHFGLGMPARAADLFDKARALREKLHGRDHRDTLNSQSHLALAYAQSGRRPDAVPLAEEAARGLKAQLGPGHRDTFASLTHLAMVYLLAGRVTDALPLAEEAARGLKAGLRPDHPDALTSLSHLAAAYLEAGRIAEGVPLVLEVWEKQKAAHGPGHPLMLIHLGNLATAYRMAGRLDEALALCQEAVKGLEARLGPDHPSTLNVRNHLALTHLKARRYEVAVPLFEELLEKVKARYGPGHTRTLNYQDNLAVAYHDAGRSADALPLLQEVVKRRKAALEPNHPDTLVSMGNLASAYQALGRRADALPLYRQAVKGLKAALGPDHPRTLAVRTNLALTCYQTNRFAEAVPLFEQVLKWRGANAVADNVDTLSQMVFLAISYRRVGRPDDGQALAAEALARARARLGEKHTVTLQIMSNLGVSYWMAGKLDRSVPLFEEYLRLLQARYERDHPEVILAMANLGVNYRDAGRLPEATALLEKVVERQRKRTDSARAQLDWVFPALAETYDLAGRFARAEPLHRKSLEGVRLRFGKEHLKTAEQTTNLGRNLLRQQKHSDAERALRESLRVREQLLPDGAGTAETKSLLGGSLLGQGKYAEAEPLLLAGYDGLKGRPAATAKARAQLAEALERLISLYDAWGMPEQAAAWRAKKTPPRNGRLP